MTAKDDMTKAVMAKAIVAFQVRLSPQLWYKLKVAAENNHRSLNAEIVHILEEALS